MPWVAGDGVVEGGEDVVAVLADGGDVAADPQPGLGSGAGAVAAGDLDLGLDRAEVPSLPLLVKGTARSAVNRRISGSRSRSLSLIHI